DAVHRVVGRCGIVLVGEGQPHRLKPLLTQEKKKVSRVVGDTPIYELIVGDEEGASPEQVPLSKLNRRLTRYPMNITRQKVDALDTRLSALSTKTGAHNQMPKGPLPQGAKVRNMQRTARRRGGSTAAPDRRGARPPRRPTVRCARASAAEPSGYVPLLVRRRSGRGPTDTCRSRNGRAHCGIPALRAQ